MALGKGLALSQGVSRGINLIPNEQVRDDLNTAAAFILPFVGQGKGEGKAGEGGGDAPEGGGGGDTPAGGAGDSPAGGGGDTPASTPDAAPEPATEAPPNPETSEASEASGSQPSPSEATPADGAGEGSGAADDPTQPIGDSPGGHAGDSPGDDPATAEGGDTPPPEESPQEAQASEDRVYRKDRAPDSPDGRKPGSRKSYIDENGDLQPANPDGEATVQQHVRGSEPAKSDSPYTSFSDQLGTAKDYGGDLITLDRGRLSQDVASGKVEGVDILNHEDVLAAHDGYVSDAQARYDANPTPKNQERLDRAQQDRANSVRDREVLVKGTVPGEYVTRTPEGGEPSAPEGEGTPPASDGSAPAGEGMPPEGGDPADAAPPRNTTGGEGAGDPLVQFGPREGGMPGEGPAEDPSGGSAAEGTANPAGRAAGNADPVVQTGDNLGGHADAPADGPADGEGAGTPTDAKEWGVTWFNAKALPFIDKANAVLGPPGGLSWLMPGEDAAGLRTVADVARETGMAPGAAEAYKTGGRIFGLAVPLDGLPLRAPVAADAGFNPDGSVEPWANDNWLDGGHTAIRIGEPGAPNGGYLVNPTHELVTEGGHPMPPGSVLFELGQNGSLMPIRHF